MVQLLLHGKRRCQSQCLPVNMQFSLSLSAEQLQATTAWPGTEGFPGCVHSLMDSRRHRPRASPLEGARKHLNCFGVAVTPQLEGLLGSWGKQLITGPHYGGEN